MTNSQSPLEVIGDEIWKPLPIHPEYEISSKGNVRTRIRRNRNCKGGIYRPMKTCIGRTRPYLRFTIRIDGRTKNIHVHRAALEAFYGPCPENFVACHNDGNRLNNNIENLRWDTKSSNTRDQLKHGTHSSFKRRGEKVNLTKLTTEQVLNIRKDLYKGISLNKTGKKYSVHSTTIFAIKHRITWKHI